MGYTPQVNVLFNALFKTKNSLEKEFLTLAITSNDPPFGFPIMCTDIYSQCYFVH